VEKMNARAAELGMKETTFVNCTGLDDDTAAENHKTSAYDIAVMSRELMKNHPEIKKYTTIWMDTVRNGAFGLSNTNKMVRFYNGCTGLKTGFTSKAGYCLSATASREGLDLVAVVMGAESSQDRFAACKQLLDYGFANYALVRPELSEYSVPVRLGTGKTVAAIPTEQGAVLIEKSQKNLISSHVELLEEVAAPVGKGQRLGTVTVKAGEQVIAQIPLVAKEGMARLTWGEIFWRIFQNLAFKKG
jgi:D-alanyl-D-alanine carboxypeptidase (penicillin-binding protein 5/6)